MYQRVIFHIDVNCAFLSWEAARMVSRGCDADPREIPAVVGGDEKSRRGIVLAKSQPAKKLGIVTGESLFSARRKCPGLMVLAADYALYKENSDKLFSLVSRFSPVVERYSIDECFLDYTGLEPLFGSPTERAYLLKDEIKARLGFTVNIGIGPNRLLAKMAGELEKPDMVHTIFYDEIEKKLWPLDIGELFMVGRQSRAVLQRCGISTVGDLARMRAPDAEYLMKGHGLMIWSYARGMDDSRLCERAAEPEKSFSNSFTLPRDVKEEAEIFPVLLSLCDHTAERMRRAGFCCLVVCVGIKNSSFETFRHQRRLYEYTDITSLLFKEAKTLFRELWNQSPVRQLSVSYSELLPAGCVPEMLYTDKKSELLKRLDSTSDRLRLKYGSRSVIRGACLSRSSPSCGESPLKMPEFNTYPPCFGKQDTGIAQ